MDNSLKLAKPWTVLGEMKESIDNVAIPLGGHLGIEDPELIRVVTK
ncbi:MAG TPA: hypothetical protein VNI02_14580 [Blastocatellia bacterium]|jgi:hypothetical protein|nr:hypothetical protein [Blastocatellia bacterium]